MERLEPHGAGFPRGLLAAAEAQVGGAPGEVTESSGSAGSTNLTTENCGSGCLRLLLAAPEAQAGGVSWPHRKRKWEVARWRLIAVLRQPSPLAHRPFSSVPRAGGRELGPDTEGAEGACVCVKTWPNGGGNLDRGATVDGLVWKGK